MRQDVIIKGALQAKHHGTSKENIHSANTVGRKVILYLDVGEDMMPNVSNAISSDMRL